MTFLWHFIFTRKDCRIKWVPLWKICCQDTVIFVLIMGRERDDSVDWVREAHWGADWQLLQKTWVTPFFFPPCRRGGEEAREASYLMWSGLASKWLYLRIPLNFWFSCLYLSGLRSFLSLLNVTFSFQPASSRRNTDFMHPWKSLLLPWLRTVLGSVPVWTGILRSLASTF